VPQDLNKTKQKKVT